MKKLLVIGLCAIGLISEEASAAKGAAGLAKVCSSVRAIGTVGVYKNSAPLRTGGVGTPLRGYRKEPSILYSRRADLPKGRTNVYDKAGTKLASCPIQSAHGFAGRGRCTYQTAVIRRKAVRNTKSPEVYFSIKKGCVKIVDSGRCYGSNKGLCNQVLG